jgi:hypothetical protein
MDETPPDIAFLTPEAIGLELPAECVPGVDANLRLLADHLERLRSFDPEMA